MAPYLNISAYQFVPLPDAQALREPLLASAGVLQLKGTILLATEGINLFLAGDPADVRAFLAGLRADPRLSGLRAKESWSGEVPFRKLLVKVKNEIIRMNQPAIRPDTTSADGRAPAVSAGTLKRWLDQGHDDEGRPVVTLDTRNTFEVEAGTFRGALDWRINKFTEFPQALLDHRDELAGKTVVSFCTGGIRCEKAAIYMREAGLPNVWQLEGGILQYFEETGGAHFDGSCFVFDARRALDSDLSTHES